MPMNQWRNGFRRTVFGRKASTARRYQKVDIVFSVAELCYCALDSRNIIRNNIVLRDLPLIVAFDSD